MSQDIMALKQNVFDTVAEGRRRLHEGMVDLSPVELATRDYCEALAAMPVEQASEHAPFLRDLTEQMNVLEQDLRAARDMVQQKLSELGQHNKANAAYKKSDGIGKKFFPPEGEDGQ